MAERQFLKQVTKLGALAGAAIFALLLTCFATLQLPPVQHMALNAAARSGLAGYGFSADISGTSGLFPWRIHADRISLADTAGPFLELERVDVELRPLAFLGGNVAIGRLAVGSGRYLRQPEPQEQEKPFRLPTVPTLFDVRNSIAIDTIELGPFAIALSDTPVTVEGGGGFRLSRKGLDANLQFEAGGAGHANLEGHIDPRARALSLSLDIADPEGRWLAPLTPLGQGTPIAATLEGEGPSDNIALTAQASWGAARFSATGNAVWQDTLAVDLSGALTNAMPGGLAAAMGGEQTFDGAVEVAANGDTEIERLSVSSQTFAATLAGTLADRIALEGDVSFNNAAGTAALLGLDELAGPSAHFNLTGRRTAPSLDVTGTATRVVAAGIPFERVQFTSQSQISHDGGAAEGGAGLTVGSIGADGLSRALAEAAAVLALDFRADLSKGQGTISSLTGAWGPVTLDASGEIAREGPVRFEGAIAATNLSLLDSRLAGEARLSGEVRRPVRDSPISVQLTGDTSDFAAAGELAEIWGQEPSFTLAAEVDGPQITLSTAELAIASGEVRAGGAVDRASGAIDLTLQSDAFNVRDIELSDISARLEQNETAGRLSLNAQGAGEPLSLDVPYERSAGNLSGTLSFAYAGLQATGPVGFADGAVHGDIHASANDIERFVTLIRGFGGVEDNLRAHGAFEADLQFDDGQGHLAASIESPFIDGINTPARAGRIALVTAFGPGPDRAPTLDGRLTATAVQFGPSRFSLIDAKAQGPLTELNATLLLQGPADNPFYLEASALRREAGAGSDIMLSAVNGQSLDFDVQLAEGGEFIVGPQGVELKPTTFNVRNRATEREGTLNAEARLWAGAPYAQLTADSVPAGALAVFGLPVDWTGVLDGLVTLDARGDAPPLRVALVAQDLTNDPDLAPLNARFTVDASGEDLDAQLSLTDAADGTPLLAAQSTVPLVWRTGEFAPHVNWDAPLNGLLRANAPLRRLWTFVPIDTLSVRGQLNADMSFAGTLGAPVAHGELHLTRGGLEHFQTGFILREGEGTLGLDEAGNARAQFTATDGNGGTAELTAVARLPRAENWDLDGRLQLNHLTVARRDEMHAVASGSLRLVGSLAAARLEGAITMDQIDAQIPNQLPPSVVELPVTRVNGDGTMETPQKGAATTRGLTVPVDLDVTVDIPRRAFVRGRGLDSEWNGGLILSGTASAPRINGSVNVVRGTFDLSRTRFTLTEGAINFLGGDRINPQVNVRAEAPGPEFTSIIRATGPARRPTITITSDPVMPQETVIAQILFGKRPEELSAFELVQIGEATASLSGAGGLDFLGTARRATGLDVLSIGAAETSAGGQDVNVTVGRYVAPNVFVGARRGFEPGSGAVTVEMEATPQVTVDAEVRQDAEGSVGVDWRWDY